MSGPLYDKESNMRKKLTCLAFGLALTVAALEAASNAPPS